MSLDLALRVGFKAERRAIEEKACALLDPCNGHRMISMFHKMREREGGFTLVELLVVIVILGILIAIAVPTFLSQQDKAKDSEVQQYLNTAYKVAKAEQASDPTGQSAFPAPADLIDDIESSEPELASALQDTAVTGTDVDAAANSLANGELGVYASGGSNLSLVGKSDSGKAYKVVITNNVPSTPLVAPVP